MRITAQARISLQLTRRTSILEGQENVNIAAPSPRRHLAGLVELPQQRFHVPQAVPARGRLERLVLGEHVDETFAQVVAVAAEHLAAPFAEGVDNLADLALRAEPLRHSAAARSSSVPPGGRASARARRPGRRPDS